MTPQQFIEKWTGREGGAERANYALFLTELCDALGIEHPQPAGADRERNDYVFERVVIRSRSIRRARRPRRRATSPRAWRKCRRRWKPRSIRRKTAAVFAALAVASGPVTPIHIAQDFRKTKNLEETIAKVLLSLARLGHVATKDGRSFEIKRVA